MKNISITLIISLYLTGCGEEKIYDTSYYKSHIDEGKQILIKCSSGEIGNQNCTNAKTAISENKNTSTYNKYKDK